MMPLSGKFQKHPGQRDEDNQKQPDETFHELEYQAFSVNSETGMKCVMEKNSGTKRTAEFVPFTCRVILQ
jgi:hypothetical protein